MQQLYFVIISYYYLCLQCDQLCGYVLHCGSCVQAEEGSADEADEADRVDEGDEEPDLNEEQDDKSPRSVEQCIKEIQVKMVCSSVQFLQARSRFAVLGEGRQDTERSS